MRELVNRFCEIEPPAPALDVGEVVRRLDGLATELDHFARQDKGDPRVFGMFAHQLRLLRDELKAGKP